MKAGEFQHWDGTPLQPPSVQMMWEGCDPGDQEDEAVASGVHFASITASCLLVRIVGGDLVGDHWARHMVARLVGAQGPLLPVGGEHRRLLQSQILPALPHGGRAVPAVLPQGDTVGAALRQVSRAAVEAGGPRRRRTRAPRARRRRACARSTRRRQWCSRRHSC